MILNHHCHLLSGTPGNEEKEREKQQNPPTGLQHQLCLWVSELFLILFGFQDPLLYYKEEQWDGLWACLQPLHNSLSPNSAAQRPNLLSFHPLFIQKLRILSQVQYLSSWVITHRIGWYRVVHPVYWDTNTHIRTSFWRSSKIAQDIVTFY